jgi:sphinganine-1-phosphate aldolase
MSSHVTLSGYISSCQDIVGSAKTIQEAIQNSFPELFVLGKPQASVVAFGSRTPSLNILEVGDKMSKKGWHLNALQNPPALHIACTVRMCFRGPQQRSDARWQRLTVSTVDNFIRDLKDAVWDAKGSPAGKGVMVSLYGACDNASTTLAAQF